MNFGKIFACVVLGILSRVKVKIEQSQLLDNSHSMQSKADAAKIQ
jgi:hypothetical protein